MATYVVNLGPGVLTNYLVAAGNAPVYVGWGIGAGTTAKTDTGLFSEVAGDLVTTTGTRVTGVGSRATVTQSNDEWIVTATLTMTASGSPVTVTNAGLFDNPTIGSGTMFAKGDHAGQPMWQGDKVTYHFQVPVSI